MQSENTVGLPPPGERTMLVARTDPPLYEETSTMIDRHFVTATVVALQL